jgi:hypothetical protein
MVALLLASSKAWSLEKTDDIDTNRPSFMDSPIVVPESSVQFENGLLFSGFHKGWIYDSPETELRVGLTNKTEFQGFTPNYNLLYSDGQNHSRVSNITELGIKHQIGPLFANSKKLPGYLKNYNLSVIVGVSPPTGSPLVSQTGTGTGGAVRFPWGKNVGKNWQIMGMQSLLLVNSGRDLQYQPDVMIARNIGTRNSAFIEYGGFFTQGGLPSNIMHFGAVRKVTRHQQIDTQFGFGLNRAAPVAFIGFGYSFRFDQLHW